MNDWFSFQANSPTSSPYEFMDWTKTPRYQAIGGLLSSRPGGSPTDIYQQTVARLSGLPAPSQAEYRRTIDPVTQADSLNDIDSLADSSTGGLLGGTPGPEAFGIAPNVDAMDVLQELPGMFNPIGFVKGVATIGRKGFLNDNPDAFWTPSIMDQILGIKGMLGVDLLGVDAAGLGGLGNAAPGGDLGVSSMEGNMNSIGEGEALV